MRKKLLMTAGGVLAILIFTVLLVVGKAPKSQLKIGNPPLTDTTMWTFQSIDTMKYSRDLAREKLVDIAFENVIDTQVKNIAETGATHIAIATPYDAEFLPFLTKWVNAARRNNLKVWYRGNWSGWEGWFEYPKISREDHIKKTTQFIKDNPDLFQAGDIFSPCPECENGGPGDPRLTNDYSGFKNFLISEYSQTSEIFRNMGKNVISNFYPMNGDVAKVIMDEKTTKALGGVVVIDHYVKTPVQLVNDINSIAKNSKGKVVLGEFGAPIEDIHGHMTEDQQAQWLNDNLELLSKNINLKGINYWVSNGGSTEIWNSDASPRKAVSILTSYYQPKIVAVTVINELGKLIPDTQVIYKDAPTQKDEYGRLYIKDNQISGTATVSAPGYTQTDITLSQDKPFVHLVLQKTNESVWFKIQKFLYKRQQADMIL